MDTKTTDANVSQKDGGRTETQSIDKRPWHVPTLRRLDVDLTLGNQGARFNNADQGGQANERS
jgi:hypothetical protein